MSHCPACQLSGGEHAEECPLAAPTPSAIVALRGLGMGVVRPRETRVLHVVTADQITPGQREALLACCETALHALEKNNEN